MAEKLRLTIDGNVYYANLRKNPLAQQIAAMCPFELDYTRSGGHEYYAALPEQVSAKGCEATTKGRRNGLYYFEGWNAFSLVFRDCDTAPYQIHFVGDFEESMSAVLEKAGGSVHILCETG